jgi:CubicO group peptidase (beta-lactamase class C family)
LRIKHYNKYHNRNCRTRRIIDSNAKVSKYIGTSWTSETVAQENLITCKNLLSMTLESKILQTEMAYWRWHRSYHNVCKITRRNEAQGGKHGPLFQHGTRDKIGMDGSWLTIDNNSVYFSTTRSMARFGLLMLNNGKWDNNWL